MVCCGGVAAAAMAVVLIVGASEGPCATMRTPAWPAALPGDAGVQLWTELRAQEPAYTALRRALPKGAARPGFDFTRTPAVLDFADWFSRHALSPTRVLSLYASDPEVTLLLARAPDAVVDLCVFDGTRRCDLHHMDLPLPGAGYDAVVFAQTLEHLYDPLLALVNVYRHLRPGGIVATSVPTHNFPHMAPFHFSHFTPVGLALLLRAAGFDVLEIGYWGNALYLRKLYGEATWPDVGDVGSPIENELPRAAQAWVLARKPVGSGRDAPVSRATNWMTMHPRVDAADIAALFAHLRLQRDAFVEPLAAAAARRAIPKWHALDAGVWAAAQALVEATRRAGVAPPRALASTPGASGAFAAALGAETAHVWSAADSLAPPPDMLIMHAHLEFMIDAQSDVEAAAVALAPGGALWIVAPTILRAADADGARPPLRAFTATGLAVTAARAGLTVLDGGAWGNLPYVDGLIDGKALTVCELERASWTARYWWRNAPTWPRAAVAWVLARKEGSSRLGEVSGDPQASGILQ